MGVCVGTSYACRLLGGNAICFMGCCDWFDLKNFRFPIVFIIFVLFEIGLRVEFNGMGVVVCQDGSP